MEISKFEVKSMFALENTSIQNLCFLHTLHGQGPAYVMYGESINYGCLYYQAKCAFGFKLGIFTTYHSTSAEKTDYQHAWKILGRLYLGF